MATVRVPASVAPVAVSPMQAIQTAQTSQAQTIASGTVAANCSGSRAFGPPNVVTFTAPTAVAAEGCKMQSYDGAVESILGTQGTVNFSVSQLPDRATLEIGGGTLYGINVVRRRLSLFAMLMQQVNYSGTTSAQLTNPINLLTANIDGTTGTQVVNVDAMVNNMQQNSALITLQKALFITGATLIKVQKAAGNEMQLTWSNISYIPYNDPALMN